MPRKSDAMVIDSPQVQDAVSNAESLAKKYSGLKITTQDEYDNAGKALQAVKLMTDSVEIYKKEKSKPFKDKIDKIKKLCDKPLKFFKEANNSLRLARASYVEEQQKIKEAEQKKLIEAAKKEEEKKKKALQVKADKARESGDEDKARELEGKKEEVLVHAPVVEKTVDKTEGIGLREDWKARVVDASLVPKEYCMPDMIKLGKIAKAMKDQAKVPGVEFYSVKTEIVRQGSF